MLTWAPVFADLVTRGRIVAYDRAGLGSSTPHRGSTAQDAVDDLTSVLEAVGPAVVVGHSWGGLLTEVLALTDLVRGLVLVDPTHEDVFSAVPQRVRAAEALMLRGIVVRHLVGRARPIVTAMAEELAVRCTTDTETREALVRAYEASYSSQNGSSGSIPTATNSRVR